MKISLLNVTFVTKCSSLHKGRNDHRKLHLPASTESTSQGVNPGEQIFYVQETPGTLGQVIISSDINLGDMEGAEFVFVSDYSIYENYSRLFLYFVLQTKSALYFSFLSLVVLILTNI